ncbi:MAG TPA: acetyltransferase, partial [Flammeovirgaceae bacterium]|nr:acetyltransferase [Flammeovirgaceae bacterium]
RIFLFLNLQKYKYQSLRLLYYLLLKPLSYMPLWLLYGLANGIYFIIYKVLGYRKQVVWANLSNSFPDMPEAERQALMRRFYRHMSELMVETLWCFSLSEKRLQKSLQVKNPELLDKYYEQGRSVVLVLGHYGSWEFVLAGLNYFVRHRVATIYIPLTSKTLDRAFHRMRLRFGAEMISKKDFAANMQAGSMEPRAIIFGADQSPSISKNIYWTEFLNQETAVALGVEKYAKKYDMPVLFTWLHKRARGRYEVEFELITDRPQDEPPGTITEKHVRLMEKQIRQRPELWMWSHRRWKKKREVAG